MTENSREAELEQQIEMLREHLHQAQKLTAMGELVSTTTHEFNNVLTTIINYAKMGIRHRDAETRDKAFEKILSAGKRAAKITQGILGFARNRSAGMEPTNLAQVADDALFLLEREMSKYRIAIDKQYRDAPPAMANSNQIQQVLINLLVNARQAMLSGGQLVVRIGYDPAQGMVELTVRDSGCGIPADKLPKIFDRFYSTKAGPDESGKGGTGLGLAFCRDVIEAHAGRIRVESTPGKGTAFILKLPVARQEHAATVPLSMPLTTAAASNAPRQ